MVITSYTRLIHIQDYVMLYPWPTLLFFSINRNERSLLYKTRTYTTLKVHMWETLDCNVVVVFLSKTDMYNSHPAKACKVGYKLGHRVLFLNFEYFIKNKNIKPLLLRCNTIYTAVSSNLIGQEAWVLICRLHAVLVHLEIPYFKFEHSLFWHMHLRIYTNKWHLFVY